jgi:3-phenylpropionate/trans-cinnamate dioxygenase ferredoxin reductase component
VIVAIARVVVAGGGLAGLRTVEELRAQGYAGEITLIGAEPRPPYDRPPLSKQLMSGTVDDTTLRADLAALEADIRLSEAATGLGEQVLRTDHGEYGFDALVLATGAHPVALPGPGRQRLLRTMDDALALRELLRPGLRLAIIGAGWIGAELATAAAGQGSEVTVLEAGPAPLTAAVGAEIGALTAPWYRAAGVSLRLGQAVESVQPGGLALAGGRWLDADEIVTAVGVRPTVGWLAGSGVLIGRGVVVDEQLRASVPGIFAAGDCAEFWSQRYGRRLRFEHWDIALRAPEVVAANILGGSAVFDPVPYFWSEQFGRMVQYVGYHGDADQMVWRGDPQSASWTVCWLGAGRLVAAFCVDAPRDVLQARRLIQGGAGVDPGRLADPAVPVRAAALG